MAEEAVHTIELFADLETLRQRAGEAFERVREMHPLLVACKPGCDDCCHAVFDLSPIEALALARAFMNLPRKERRKALRAAQKASEAFDRLMAEAMQKTASKRMEHISRARIACPLLHENRCLLYEQRPLTCRFYGIPTAIRGKSATCAKAGFKPGQSYPTVDLSLVHGELDRMSKRLLELSPGLPDVRLDMGRVLTMADDLAG